jgi:hypothetical protein
VVADERLRVLPLGGQLGGGARPLRGGRRGDGSKVEAGESVGRREGALTVWQPCSGGWVCGRNRQRTLQSTPLFTHRPSLKKTGQDARPSHKP